VVKKAVYAIIAIIILALAGSLPAYLALGQEGSQQATVTITAQPVYIPPRGGGVPGVVPDCPAGEVATGNRASSTTGLVFRDFVIKSFDKKFSLFIDQGIVVLTPDGKCPRCIGIHEMTPPPSPPEGAHLIGTGYDVVPDLTAFTPPATIIYSYDPKDIPEGIAEENLSIALRDEATGEWMKLDCLVDTEAHTITAKIGRFNDLAVLGYEPVVPAPASFQPGSLSISPGEVKTGQTVNISVTVTNSGGSAGSYALIFKIDGVVEEIKEITLEAGTSGTASFSTSRQLAGTYSAEVNGLTSSFVVKQPRPTAPFKPTPTEPTPTEPLNWWLIGGIIAGVVIVGFVIFLVIRRMSY
jgi:hypothetical protein